MSFGKPKLSPKPVRCINCGGQYPEHDLILHHAGRDEEGDWWNSECPECGRIGSMQPEYAELSDQEFREKQHEVARLRHDHR